MLGENVEMSRKVFNPYCPRPKEGYYDIPQIKPGVCLCPRCNSIIDATQNPMVRAAYETIMVWPSSWASVPVCSCPGVWAVYSPLNEKWSFRWLDHDVDPESWK